MQQPSPPQSPPGGSQYGVSPADMSPFASPTSAPRQMQQIHAEAASPLNSRPPPQSSFEELLPAGVVAGNFPDDIGGDETDRGGAFGNRWPRQETLALLKIRSDMDAVFRDATLKGPLWEEVSRKLAELGYRRSAKKCKEKFENVHKYYKRTKENRAGRQDGKMYRFFSQLEALHGSPTTPTQATVPILPLASVQMPTTQIPVSSPATIGFSAPMAGPSRVVAPVTVTAIEMPSSQPMLRSIQDIGTSGAPPQGISGSTTTTAAPTTAGISFSSNTESSESDESDDEDTEEIGGTQEQGKRKRQGGSGGGSSSSLIFDGCDKPIDHSFSEQAHGVSTSADWAGSSWQIANLQILDLHNFVTLDRLPNMPLSLIEFQVHNVGLTSLPDLYQSSDSRGSPSASSLKSSLRKVRISNCQNLTSLNGFLQQDNDFRFIEHIEVTNCRNLVHLPVGAFGKFVSLQALTISNCPMLTAADNHSNLLPMALKDLSIENCGEIDEPLLESVSNLATLTFLSINNCANILRISLENAFGSLSSLRMNAYDKHVEHSSRKQTHGVSQGSNLSSLMLSRLEIDHLSLLLIEPLRSLRSVRNLRVWSCSGLEALPEQWFLQNSSTLSWLSIRNASTLKSLLATMERLSSLQWLEIWQADLLRELPELPTSLRSLVIRDASSLRSLPATMARLSALEWLEIWKANLLEELPELPVSLKQKYIEGHGVTSQLGTFPRSYLSLARV